MAMADIEGSDTSSCLEGRKVEDFASGEDDTHCDVGGKEPNSSDNASVASGSSDDSEMEPFEDYLLKIEQLLSDIGLNNFSVEALQHGYTYQNCVYALEAPGISQERYILRVPVCPDLREKDKMCEAIINEVHLLNHLADKLLIPRVKAYSATPRNALNTPFSIQTRLPGQSLDNVFQTLSYEDKVTVADQFIDLLRKIESVNFSTAGTFTGSTDLPEAMIDYAKTSAPSVTPFTEGDEDFVQNPTCLRDRVGPNVKALLTSHLDGWIVQELKGDEVHQSFIVPPFRRLLALIKDMCHEGSLNDGPYPVVLNHWDLEPRNIMVEKINGAWKICGIIDWDGASALPRPLARRPPAWIWDFEPDMMTGYLDNDFHPNDQLSEEDAALKNYFDRKAAAILPDYVEDAYGRGRWLRRIWILVKNKIHSSWYLDLMDQLLKDWDARPKSVVPRPGKSRNFWKRPFDWSVSWLTLGFENVRR